LAERLSRAPVTVVPLDSVVVADSPRLGGASDDHVAALVESGAKLPPIVVHRGTMRVVDGVHRVRAAMRRGDTGIEVRFFDGDERDGFVLAVKANVAHGLPLSRAERVAAASRILASHVHWSDRVIAEIAGLAPSTVATVRRRVAGSGEGPTARMGRDGRVRPVSTSRGRALARELMTGDPEASLRRVAVAAGISPGTVRLVREEMLAEAAVGARGGRPRSNECEPAAQGVRSLGRPQPDRVSMLRNLQQDPSLRLTETGRAILRLLDFHALLGGEHERFVDSVPGHCLPWIAELARSNASIWHRFAEALDRRQQTDA
jgi:hypothetical protein